MAHRAGREAGDLPRELGDPETAAHHADERNCEQNERDEGVDDQDDLCEGREGLGQPNNPGEELAEEHELENCQEQDRNLEPDLDRGNCVETFTKRLLAFSKRAHDSRNPLQLAQDHVRLHLHRHRVGVFRRLGHLFRPLSP